MFTRTMLKKIAPLLSISLLALTACVAAAPDEPPIDSGPGQGSDDTPGDAIPVEGIEGTWTFADGTDSAGAMSIDAPVTLMISGESISGESACNNYTASLTGEPNDLTITNVVSTMRACENALMDFETRYFTALELVTAAIPTGGSLVLQGDGVNLNFVPEPSPPHG